MRGWAGLAPSIKVRDLGWAGLAQALSIKVIYYFFKRALALALTWQIEIDVQTLGTFEGLPKREGPKPGK